MLPCLAGNCSSTTSLPYEYQFVDKNMTWTEAQSYCRNNYTDLATIDNTEDMYRLMKSVNGGFTNGAWIGLKEGERMGTWQWSDQSNCSFRNWNIGQPDNQGGDQTCVVTWMNVTGPWDDMKCNATGMNKVILITEKKTWTDALNYCRENHDDLVSVLSEEVQKGVEFMAKKASTPHVWLGLRYTCTLNIWFWVSGEPICYSKWSPGNGTCIEDCGRTRVGRTGAVETDGPHHWVSLPDIEQLNFICKGSESENRVCC
uniref:C-type lectin domain-containing protein n=1 Tax=Esox lucius TaxID=8010 RepID=A0AAY5KNR7_ESOLU